MINRLIFQNPTYIALRERMNEHADEEDAAFFAYREYETEEGRTLLIRKILPISEHNIISRSRTHIEIEGRAAILAMHDARLSECSVGFIHSHPDGSPNFSPQDDELEADMARTTHLRLREADTFATLIWCDGRIADGRMWKRSGVRRPLHRVSVVGETLNFYPIEQQPFTVDEAFDRQRDVLPWRVQRALRDLHVGVVGAGGTGSAVMAQLIRLGVGAITIVDGDRFEASNANRVHGSSMADEGLPKVQIAERFLRSMGFGTRIRTFNADIDREDIAKAMRSCDVIFGCTDDELGRSVLARLSFAYLIPVFDMGVAIDTTNKLAIAGRVTTLLPNESCLLCRDRISADNIHADTLRKHRPDEAEELEREGYIRGVRNVAPSVVTFTTMTASIAINELLHRLIELYGSERKSSEVLYRVVDQDLRSNRKPKRPGCFCGASDFVGFGDMVPFLDRTWSH